MSSEQDQGVGSTTVAEEVAKTVSKRDRDPECLALERILRIAETLDPETRVRVLQYNLARAFSLLQPSVPAPSGGGEKARLLSVPPSFG